MLKDAEKAMKSSIRARPGLKHRSYSGDDILQAGKVAAMQTAAPDELPHSLEDSIQGYTDSSKCRQKWSAN